MKYKNGFKHLAKKSMFILSTSLMALTQNNAQNILSEGDNDKKLPDAYFTTETQLQNQLILKLNQFKDENKLLAFHGSHSSHSSHSSHHSHYSGGSGGGSGSALPLLIGGGALLWGATKLLSNKDSKNKK